MARFVLSALAMRLIVAVVVMFLGACGGGLDIEDGEDCPMALEDGASCGFSGRCWRQNNFSPCLSGWCACEGGRVSCEAIAPSTGDACGDEPITHCSYEGNVSCMTAPTSQFCTCTGDGSWRCACACYGPSTTCGSCPEGLPLDQIEGLQCEIEGSSCPYATGTCSCVADGEVNKFRCTP